MKHYFIQLDGDQMSALKAAGFNLPRFSLDGVGGFLIEEPDMKGLLKALHVKMVDVTETSYEGVSTAGLEPLPDAASARKAYIQKCTARFKSDADKLGVKVEEARGKAEATQQALAKQVRELRDLELRLNALQEANSSQLERFGAEFDRLIAHPIVSDVRVTDDVVEIYTREICCKDDRTAKIHSIGEFKISLSRGFRTEKNPGVHFRNLTRVVDTPMGSFYAPHCKTDFACLGNSFEPLKAALDAHEYFAAASVAIAFLQSADTKDRWAEYVNRWPERK